MNLSDMCCGSSSAGNLTGAGLFDAIQREPFVTSINSSKASYAQGYSEIKPYQLGSTGKVAMVTFIKSYGGTAWYLLTVYIKDAETGNTLLVISDSHVAYPYNHNSETANAKFNVLGFDSASGTLTLIASTYYNYNYSGFVGDVKKIVIDINAGLKTTELLHSVTATQDAAYYLSDGFQADGVAAHNSFNNTGFYTTKDGILSVDALNGSALGITHVETGVFIAAHKGATDIVSQLTPSSVDVTPIYHVDNELIATQNMRLIKRKSVDDIINSLFLKFGGVL